MGVRESVCVLLAPLRRPGRLAALAGVAIDRVRDIGSGVRDLALDLVAAFIELVPLFARRGGSRLFGRAGPGRIRGRRHDGEGRRAVDRGVTERQNEAATRQPCGREELEPFPRTCRRRSLHSSSLPSTAS
jgi:hypothetical protein